MEWAVLWGWSGVELLVLSLFASLLAAVAGFGGSVILLPVLVHLFGIKEAVPILTVAQLIGNGSRVWFGRTEINWKVVAYFCITCIPTAIIGATMFTTLPAGLLKRMLGIFLLITLAYRYSGFKKSQMKLYHFTILGALAGWLSALVGTVGPLAAPFFLDFGLVGNAYIATEAMTAVVMHITKGVVYAKFALISWQSLIIGLLMGVVMFGGSFIGKNIVERLSKVWFTRLVEAVVLLAGIQFLVL